MTATTHWFACGCGRHFVVHTPESERLGSATCPHCHAVAPAMPSPVVAFSPVKPVSRSIETPAEKRKARR